MDMLYNALIRAIANCNRMYSTQDISKEQKKEEDEE